MNHEQRIDLAIEHFTTPTPQSQIIHSAWHCQIVSPTLSVGPMNTVTRFSVAEGDLAERVNEVLDPYLSRNLSCWWLVTPSSRPFTLEEELKRRGFKLDHEEWGLIASTDLQVPCTKDVTLEELSESNLEDYLSVGFGKPPYPDSLKSYFLSAIRRGEGKFSCYLARYKGKPAGNGILQILGDFGNFGSGFVTPESRGLGIYRALVQHRLSELKKREIPYAVVLSKKETSAPILLRLGFSKVYDFKVLSHE